ncbi:MAG: TonB-dependent receptor [Bacteroidetes bacterium]|nr:TonB-dependent receptor [Bacteroidota bacterium]
MKRLSLLLVLQLISFSIFSQSNIFGTVTDTKGEPLIGANVQLKNTLKGTYTSLDGKFSIKYIKNRKYTIVISYMGYKNLSEEINLEKDLTLSFKLKRSNVMSDEIMISSTRAGQKVPATYSNINKKSIGENNLGQDIPYLLSLSPSVVTSSDAGAGIGYTNIRIRGTDANRINVTINGIPYNDPESHGVFWVNLPDLASSINNVQIQRGVGTSTNGAGAFGATINMQTLSLEKDAYAEINNSVGSFQTWKSNVRVGSGLINNKFTFDARLSKIESQGFIDRSASDLKSFFISGGYYNEHDIVKLNISSGKEITGQAWNGVPKCKLENNSAGMAQLVYDDGWSDAEKDNLFNSNSRTFNRYIYDNQTDNYQQDHYQLFYSHEINNFLNINTALHYTKGYGYYESYKYNKEFSKFGLSNAIINTDTITSSDFIYRKLMDNDFYGITYSMNYKLEKINASIGGAYNIYEGDHFGNVIWAQNSINNFEKDHEYYRNKGTKKDFNIYAKMNYFVNNKLNIYGDVQFRNIEYTIDGIDDDFRNLDQNHKFDFINPKAGIYYTINDKQNAYFSFGIANREPNRHNYTDADTTTLMPTNETLNDFEFGYTFNTTRAVFNLNLYYMDYKDQLVLTGDINDVGSAIMANVDKSYRTGVELSAGLKFTDNLRWDLNTTLSKNKIKNFTQYVDNWDNWKTKEQDISNLGETDLAFSPNIIANSLITYNIKNLSVKFISNYVGKQYIDNTASDERKLDAYFINNIKIDYGFKTKLIKNINLSLMVNNIFNCEYETNAWVYQYTFEGERRALDGYFPQAGINFLAGLTLKF